MPDHDEALAMDNPVPDPAADFAVLEQEVLTNMDALESALYSIRALIRLTEVGKTFRAMLMNWQAVQQRVTEEGARLERLKMAIATTESSRQAADMEYVQQCQHREELYAARVEKMQTQHDTRIQVFAEEEDKWQAWAQGERRTIEEQIRALTLEKEQLMADTASMRTALDEMRAKVVHIAGV